MLCYFTLTTNASDKSFELSLARLPGNVLGAAPPRWKKAIVTLRKEDKITLA
ncbi:MAG: hypothetical protein ABSH38_18635 [Verrucomicrobiota bacterium]|jgi:hypothetical protein